MTFKLSIKPQAEKALDKLPQNYRVRIAETFREIITNPFAGKKLSGKKKGQYSVRVWPYRIIYMIEKRQLVIIVVDVDHRGNVYK